MSLPSNTLGRFTPHTFYIRIGKDGDLDPADEMPYVTAPSLHAHEYIHHLHNVSTVSGLHLYLANLWLLRSLAHATSVQGYFPGESSLTDSQTNWVNHARAWLKTLTGTISWTDPPVPRRPVASWCFGTAHLDSVSIPLKPLHYIETFAIDLKAVDLEEGVAQGRLDIGHFFLTEGVAYEVERQMRRNVGTSVLDLDAGTPPYPYLAYGALVDHLVGRETSTRERVDLGTLSLLTSSPGRTFFELCIALRRAEPIVPSRCGVPEASSERVLACFNENAMKMIDRTLAPELKALCHGPPISEGAQDVTALFRAGFALRTINPRLEHRFLEGPLDRDRLRALIAGMVDCCVLQEKSDGRIESLWIGPGIVAHDGASMTSLAILQAAMHFAQRHFSVIPVAATNSLKPEPCPYTGGCPVQTRDGNPIECITRPWERFLRSAPGDPICWYAAGVRAFGRPAAR